MLSATTLMAQSTTETVHLKNGGLVRGTIIEQVPGQSLKIQTKDGNVFVYKMDEVERITKDAQPASDDKGHRGLDYNVELGYDIATKGGGGNLAAEVEIGKRFNKNFYWGFIGSGAYIPTGDGDPLIPIYTHLKAYMPLKSSKIEPFVGLKTGYVINTADDYTEGKGKYKVNVEMPNYIMVGIMPGVQFPLSEKVDFSLSAGYTHFIPTKGSNSSGAIAIRAGFAFHKSAIRREPVPTRDKGVQLTLEGGWLGLSDSYYGPLANLVLTYKLNPRLSFGIGGGVDVPFVKKDDAWTKTFTSRDGRVSEPEPHDIDDIPIVTKAFVRGQYRLNDNKLSPFAVCDLGWRWYSWESESEMGANPFDINEKVEKPSSSLFVAPAIGLSLRTFNNSYLELKAGVSLANGAESLEYTVEERNGVYHYKRQKVSLSAPFASIGWTHTFGSRKR